MISKKYFTTLYSPIRERAFISKNIKAGFTISGLFLFNPDRVLRNIPVPLAKLAIPSTNKVKVRSY